MREKSQMHFKEAKEEAMRLRESADNISPDDEEDDDEKIAPTVRTTISLPLFPSLPFSLLSHSQHLKKTKSPVIFMVNFNNSRIAILTDFQFEKIFDAIAENSSCSEHSETRHKRVLYVQ